MKIEKLFGHLALCKWLEIIGLESRYLCVACEFESPLSYMLFVVEVGSLFSRPLNITAL